jgi:hypothetical protein
MRIQIAYLTTDQVNHTLALGMAQKCGASLVHNPPGLARTNGALIAVLYDLDHLSEQDKEAVLADHVAGPATVPVAIHSYNLGEDQLASLSAKGVIVARSLELELVRRLCDASRLNQKPDPAEEDRGREETLVEPATLCAHVRSLAIQAHRMLTRKPCPLVKELDGLSQQLTDLERAIERLGRSHSLQFDELKRWLESLMKRVQDRRFDASA